MIATRIRRRLQRSSALVLGLLAVCSGSAGAQRSSSGVATAASAVASVLSEPAPGAGRPTEDLVRERFRLRQRLDQVTEAERAALLVEDEALARAIQAGEPTERLGLAPRGDLRESEGEWRARYAGATAEDLDVAGWRLTLRIGRDVPEAFERRFDAGLVERELHDSFDEG